MVLFVGFFSREKCPHVLFDAWARLHHDGLPQTALVFVGATRSPYYEVDHRLAEEIREAARRLGLEGKVIFAGESRAVEQYYAAADLFVLPSLREGLPNTLLEAMASGLCCIASRIPGITDTLIDHGVNGLLVRPGDALELEQALRQALEAPASAHAWGRRARKTVEERWVIDRVAEQYLAAYQQLASPGTSRRECAAL
jgi:glycosyltransferase involved in cell wall biosynthesis